MCSPKMLAVQQVRSIFASQYSVVVSGEFDGASCTYEAAMQLIRHRRFPSHIVRKNAKAGIVEMPKLVQFIAEKIKEAGLCNENDHCDAFRFVKRKANKNGLISSADLATCLCAGRATITRWQKAIGFPLPVSKEGMSFLWSEAEVGAWLNTYFNQSVTLPLIGKSKVISVVRQRTMLPISELIANHGFPLPLEGKGSLAMARWNYPSVSEWLTSFKP